MDSGGQSVMITLIQLMLMLLVDSWDIQTTITITVYPCMLNLRLIQIKCHICLELALLHNQSG